MENQLKYFQKSAIKFGLVNIWGYAFGIAFFWFFREKSGELFGFNLIGGIYIVFWSFIFDLIFFSFFKLKSWLPELSFLLLLYLLAISFVSGYASISDFFSNLILLWHFSLGIVLSYILTRTALENFYS